MHYMFCIEMKDVGDCSWELYYLCAKDEEDALRLFSESSDGGSTLKRPHSVTKYEHGEVAVEIY